MNVLILTDNYNTHLVNPFVEGDKLARELDGKLESKSGWGTVKPATAPKTLKMTKYFNSILKIDIFSVTFSTRGILKENCS